MIFWGGLLLLVILLIFIILEAAAGLFKIAFDFIFQPKKTFNEFKQKGVFKTVMQYIKDAFDDPMMKGWSF